MLFAILWGVLDFTLNLIVIVPNCDPYGQISIKYDKNYLYCY